MRSGRLLVRGRRNNGFSFLILGLLASGLLTLLDATLTLDLLLNAPLSLGGLCHLVLGQVFLLNVGPSLDHLILSELAADGLEMEVLTNGVCMNSIHKLSILGSMELFLLPPPLFSQKTERDETSDSQEVTHDDGRVIALSVIRGLPEGSGKTKPSLRVVHQERERGEKPLRCKGQEPLPELSTRL